MSTIRFYFFFTQISYSPNIGELLPTSGSPTLSSSSNNTIHMFPLQMMPTTVRTLLDFYGWKKAIVLTEQHTQIEVANPASFSSIITLKDDSLILRHCQAAIKALEIIRLHVAQRQIGRLYTHTCCMSTACASVDMLSN